MEIIFYLYRSTAEQTNSIWSDCLLLNMMESCIVAVLSGLNQSDKSTSCLFSDNNLFLNVLEKHKSFQKYQNKVMSKWRFIEMFIKCSKYFNISNIKSKNFK